MIEEKMFRMWFYFRTGYTTYLSFIIGMISFITTTYYLAIHNIPFLQTVFPSIITYAIFLIICLPPIGTVIGWMHIKRSLAFTSGMAIAIEANPFTYKIKQGIEKELSYPYIITMVNFMETMLVKNELLTDEHKTRLDDMRKKAEHLLDGGSLGLPNDLRITELDLKEKRI